MIKWKLMLTTLPIVALAVAAKFAYDVFMKHQGYQAAVDFADVSPVLTAGAFLIGFMLAGTMTDYKESEKLPADIACTLETIEDAMVVCSFRKDVHLAPMRQKLFDVTDGITQWFAKRKPLAEVHADIYALNAYFQEMDKAGGTAHAGRGMAEIHNLRKALTRVDVIGKTGFLSSGYALLDVMVTAIVALLVIAKFKSEVAQYTLITFITLVYVYLLRLIRDIDDPFEYAEAGVKTGAAEVDLFPLLQYRDRAKARLSSQPEAAARVA